MCALIAGSVVVVAVVVKINTCTRAPLLTDIIIAVCIVL